MKTKTKSVDFVIPTTFAFTVRSRNQTLAFNAISLKTGVKILTQMVHACASKDTHKLITNAFFVL